MPYAFGEMCRTCLATNEDLRSIFTESCAIFRDFLVTSFSLKVKENDGLPSVVCEKCIFLICQAHEFKLKCLDSYSKLNKLLLEKETKTEDISLIKNHDDIKIEYHDNDNNKSEITVELQKTMSFDLSDSLCNNRSRKRPPGVQEINVNAKCKWNCTLCIRYFSTKLDLENHVLQQHKMDLHKCKICDRQFSISQSLLRHMKIHEGTVKKDKLCTICGKCFIRLHDLKRHMRIHTNERPYSCDQCPKSYKQSSELNEHLKTHSSIKNYVCTVCGKSIATRNGFYVHMKIHRGEKKHKCSLCGNCYTTSGELTSHTNHIHAKRKPFQCNYESCERCFVTKVSLETHMRSHSGEKRFHCTTCKKALATPSSLREHKRIHTGEKLKECSNCNRKLVNSQALKKHMRIHTGERPYECTTCLERFICKTSLSTHLKAKHVDKQSECPVCHRTFVLVSKPGQQHSSDGSLLCKDCSDSIDQSANLQHHIKVRHFSHVGEILNQFEEPNICVLSQYLPGPILREMDFL